MNEITPQPGEPTRFTVEQYLALVQAGELAEDDRVELLEGVIVAMPPIGSRHAMAVTYLNTFFVRALGDRALLRPQSPFVAGERSLPEPDLALVAGGLDAPPRGYPKEAFLLVEVSDSTLRTDRLTKSRIYAAAGVPEYWIVNLRANVVEIFRGPQPKTARWAEEGVVAPGERIAPLAFPDAMLSVQALMHFAADEPWSA